MTEEYSIALKIIKKLPNEIIIKQWKILGRFIDFYLSLRRLGIEIDEKGNIDRSEDKEKK